MEKELQFLIYNTPDNNISVNSIIKGDTIWLTQKSMAELFDVEVPAISKHLTNIYAEGELDYQSTVSKMETVQTEGKRQVSRQVDHYNLQMIISLGFKVNNEKAVQFRKWANLIVKNYTIKGWAMDDERLKDGFLTLWDREVLQDKGKISKELAKLHAETEFEEYRIIQDRLYESDFDRFMLENGGGDNE